jgi:tetratricopeptide (TPR) repeat protein
LFTKFIDQCKFSEFKKIAENYLNAFKFRTSGDSCFNDAEKSKSQDNKIQLYSDAGNYYLKSGSIYDSLLKDTLYINEYKMAAFSYYQVALEMNENIEFVKELNWENLKKIESGLSSGNFDIIKGATTYYSQYSKEEMTDYYQKSINLFKKAKLENHAVWMESDNEIAVFKFNEIKY